MNFLSMATVDLHFVKFYKGIKRILHILMTRVATFLNPCNFIIFLPAWQETLGLNKKKQ